MKVIAETRKLQGSGASRRLRRAGKVPGIIYGGNGEPSPIEVDHNPLYHSMRVEAFHSSVLDLELDGKPMQVLLRDTQWHAYKQQVMHVDFQRIDANQKITMRVPLHFMNQEVSPAVKTQSAVINHVMTEIEVICLPADLPSYVEVDLGEISVEHSVHVSAIKFPTGVNAVLHGSNDPVVASASLVGASPAEETSAAAAPAAGAKAAPAAAGKAAPAAAGKAAPAGGAKAAPAAGAKAPPAAKK